MNQMEMKKKALWLLKIKYSAIERARKMWEANPLSDTKRIFYFDRFCNYLGAKAMAFHLGILSSEEYALPDTVLLMGLDSPTDCDEEEDSHV